VIILPGCGVVHYFRNSIFGVVVVVVYMIQDCDTVCSVNVLVTNINCYVLSFMHILHIQTCHVYEGHTNT
jgi:hypothetical protein